MEIMHYIGQERLQKLIDESSMVKTTKIAEKVFKVPQIECTESKYNGPAQYFEIFKIKIKKPNWLVFKTESKDIQYYYRFEEFTITSLPYAKFTFFGKTITCKYSTIPTTNTTNPKNYWTSVLDYCYNNRKYKGKTEYSVYNTVMHLGKESLGVAFNDSYEGTRIKNTTSWNYEEDNSKSLGNKTLFLGSGDFKTIDKGKNSMSFIVDPSYLKTDALDNYFRACDRYNREESPLLI